MGCQIMIHEILYVYDMDETKSIARFLDAQRGTYEQALTEIRNGRKRSHWMWYIYPQLLGLGFTDTSRYYAIKNLEEARQYLDHPVLGKRLVEITEALLQQKSCDAHEIFGSPDDLKLKSCMTLFSMTENADPVFDQVISEFFEGQRDQKTITLLGF